MHRMLRDRLSGLALLLLVGLAGATAEARLFAPNAPPREANPSIPTEIEADPVLSALDAIGKPGALPRIGAAHDIAPVTRMSGGGGGGTDAIFPGGAASTTGSLRFLDGVSDARDPLQLLPAEPSVAQRVPVPASAGLLLGAIASLALLRRMRRRAASI